MTEPIRTYLSFYADKKAEPAESDIKCHDVIKAWDEGGRVILAFVNRGVKDEALREKGTKEALTKTIQSGLKESASILLVIGETTKQDTVWVPLEISYAVDECRLPVIAAYKGYKYILDPSKLAGLWPPSLKERIDRDTARVIHIPFERDPMFAALLLYESQRSPDGALSYFSRDAYAEWGLVAGID